MARPRSFDQDEVLRVTRDLFWSAGYAAARVDDIPLVVGGTIPPRDVATLTALGVRAVFGVGTPIEDVVGGVMALAAAALGDEA